MGKSRRVGIARLHVLFRLFTRHLFQSRVGSARRTDPSAGEEVRRVGHWPEIRPLFPTVPARIFSKFSRPRARLGRRPVTLR